MIYEICTILFGVGALGIAAQALLGGLHIGHASGHGASAHTGPAHVGHADAAQGGHASHAGHPGHEIAAAHGASTHTGRASSRVGSMLMTILSPLTLFSFCLGAGATGLLVERFHFAVTVVALIALAGGAVFFGAIIRPLFTFLLKFASTPSTALEGVLAHEAEAISSFDANGKGLVQLTVDGQLVRVLALLEPDEHVHPSDIAPGDLLTVTSVDGHTNTCRVARL